MEQLARLIKSVAKVELSEVKAIGVGSIGPLDIRRGVILNPPNTLFRNVPIVEVLQRSFGEADYSP